MIRVKVYPAPWQDRSKVDARGWMTVPEGTTLRAVLKLLRCGPIQAKLLVFLNGERAPLSTVLKDGDIIGMLMVATGG